MIVQQLAVDIVVAAAAAWLVWSFGPESLRRWVKRSRRAKPSYDVALRADGLAGEAETARPAGECGCGRPRQDKSGGRERAGLTPPAPRRSRAPDRR